MSLKIYDPMRALLAFPGFLRRNPSGQLVLAAGLLGAAGQVSAHAHLAQSAPAADTVLSASPSEIRLEFSEDIEPAFTRIGVQDAQHHAVATSQASADERKASVVRLSLPVLVPGRYDVQWSVVARDGHRSQGHYGFTLK